MSSSVKKNLPIIIGIVILIALGVFIATYQDSSDAEMMGNPPLDDYVSCSRNAEVRTTNVKINNKQLCEATTVIQGISYKCGRLENTDRLLNEYLFAINSNAESRCAEFCKEVGPQCASSYTVASKCFTPHGDLKKLGEFIGCNPNACEGTAFIYCSIFKGSFFRIEDKMFEKEKPNCICRMPKQQT